MNRNESRVIHPFLFAIFSIVFLFSYNIAELSLIEHTSITRIIIPVGVTLCSTLLLWELLNILFKDKHKAGIMTSLLLFMFFTYGHFYYFYSKIRVDQFGREILFEIGTFIFGRYKLYFSLCITLFILVLYVLRKTSTHLPIFTYFLNIVTGTLLIISLTNITLYEVKRFSLSDTKHTKPIVSNLANGETTTFPDIYYIILDAYAAESSLKEIYHYDNQEFLNYLRERGFYIASQSRSNYTFTILSLASSLNFQYINFLSDKVGEDSKDLRVPIQMVKNNKVIRFLKSRVYKFIHFKSGYTPTELNEYADWDVNCDKGFIQDSFVKLLVQTTMLEPLFHLYHKFYNISEYSSKRDRILCQFSTLSQLHRIKGPIFVFAHIPAPHWPYIFGASGEGISEEESRKIDKKTLYVNQLIFISKKVKVLIDEILSRSENPPIILLQADHGPWNHWSLTGNQLYKHRMRILNAYYLPLGGNAFLYDSITPVNTFRVIFNYYFGANYELLDDQSYYSWFEKPYEFIDVTDSVTYN